MNNLENTGDSRLTYLIKIGVKEAFQELFERYAPKIYHFAISYLKNEQDAEELVQNVFLKIWEKREMLDKSRNIKSLVFKIAVNDIYDQVRRKNIENAFRDYKRSNGDDLNECTWHTVIVDEMLAHIDKLLEELPGQQRKIFRLSRQNGLSNADIAKKLDISKRTVENQLYRAMIFLKKRFNCE